MTIHREGFKILALTIVILGAIDLAIWYYFNIEWLHYSIFGASIILFLLVLQFFRSPTRIPTKNPSTVLAPADGKVVVIEEVEETEYFKDKRIQVSIFMSPVNVHVNWYPIPGKVDYYKYHPGKYLVAWHPKSSELNERTTIVVKQDNGQAVLFRQIAGAMARRIICYSGDHTDVEQGKQCGFIRFGSRVDLFLPLDAKIKVGLEQKVQGCLTTIAEL